MVVLMNNSLGLRHWSVLNMCLYDACMSVCMMFGGLPWDC